MRLLDWMDSPSPERGVRVAVTVSRRHEWSFTSYQELAEQARRLAGWLRQSGVAPGDVVALAQRAGPHFIASFFGTLLAGATPAPVAVPPVSESSAYRERMEAVLAAGRPVLMLTATAQAEAVAEALPDEYGSLPLIAVEDALAAPAAARAPAERGDGAAPALLQFTSGSSGRPRGLVISARALSANLAAIRDWLGLRPDTDAAVSWLPVHHDMGLVGTVLTGVVSGVDLWLLQPEQFLRNPLGYLEVFGTRGATVAILPSFGLEYLARRVRAADLDGFDFSAWRAIIVGAERVDAASLDAVARLLGPAGLRPEAFLPAYGLAEATLAVTGTPWAERHRTICVDPRTLQPGETVRLQAAEEGGQALTGCGRPMRGVAVRVADSDGAPVPPGAVGEIRVRTDALADGYRTAAGSSGLSLDGEWLRTGDGGFFRDGDLYVLGRLADSLKVRGQLIFADDLEEGLRKAGAPRGKAVVLLGYHQGTQHVVGIFERTSGTGDWLERAPALLASAVPDARLSLLHVPRGVIKFTTSGKPRRQLMWQEFVSGSLDLAIQSRMTCPASP